MCVSRSASGFDPLLRSLTSLAEDLVPCRPTQHPLLTPMIRMPSQDLNDCTHPLREVLRSHVSCAGADKVGPGVSLDAHFDKPLPGGFSERAAYSVSVALPRADRCSPPILRRPEDQMTIRSPGLQRGAGACILQLKC